MSLYALVFFTQKSEVFFQIIFKSIFLTYFSKLLINSIFIKYLQQHFHLHLNKLKLNFLLFFSIYLIYSSDRFIIPYVIQCTLNYGREL